MFMGEYRHGIDNKGRLIFPVKFRDELGGNFVITKGLDKCLFVYSFAEWSILENKLKSLPMAKKDARAFVRFFFAGASEVECDKQGRVLIPSNLRLYAGLQKDVVVIGVSNRIELWDEISWQKYNEDVGPAVTDIAEELGNFGI